MMLAEQLLANPKEFASAFNFGPSDEDAWPVERIATKLASMWGEGAAWVCDEAPHVHEDHYLRLDASRARSELGWQPRLKIEMALEWSMNWYRSWQRGEDMKQYTLSQITSFEKLRQ
jgi:CDP-glucose 4,6-dehydratase